MKQMRDAGNSWAEIAKVCYIVSISGNILVREESDFPTLDFPDAYRR